ncbi:MAG: J domain-containing protein [Coriobacteriales bacterium]|jgi:curved DNA-binding protein|nr:J domain-containing protein [Coriobacteriales bacterium]
METKEKNYYQILGVAETASAAEIKKAFKRLAREHHPDTGGDEARFKEVSEAYETLSDAEKREQYDTFLKYGAFAAAGGGQGGFNPWAASGRGGASQGGWRTVTDYGDMGSWSDIFSRIAHGEGAFGTDWEFPGRKTKGNDRQVTLEVSFEEAFNGATKRITVRGSDGTSQQLDVKVPAGAVEGGKLRYKGKGGAGSGGGAPGDLVVVTAIKPHELYSRKGANVLMELPLALDEAALGATITVPAPDGSKVRLKVPPGTQEGKVFLIKGKGAARVKGDGHGDLRVKAKIVVPEALSDAEREAFEALAQARKEGGEKVRAF